MNNLQFDKNNTIHQHFNQNTFPRFESLKEVLLYQFENKKNFRGILFVQQRIMTHILE